MKLNSKSSFLLGYLVVMYIFWIGLQVSHIKDSPINLVWGIGINFIPTFGGLFGLSIARQWGGFKSFVGKAIGFLSLGLLSWSIGNWIWSYYNFFGNIDVPYPSFADIGYILAVPLWTIGIFQLSKVTGAKFSVRRVTGRLYVILLPIIVGVFSYFSLFVVARASRFDWTNAGILKIFFDLAYPIGDWKILTLAFLIWGLSLKYLGGRYRWPIFTILFGFILMFFADFSFSYSTTLGSYYNGGPFDIIFVLALFVISFGISNFDNKDS
jgi:hypothetical protein